MAHTGNVELPLPAGANRYGMAVEAIKQEWQPSRTGTKAAFLDWLEEVGRTLGIAGSKAILRPAAVVPVRVQSRVGSPITATDMWVSGWLSMAPHLSPTTPERKDGLALTPAL